MSFAQIRSVLRSLRFRLIFANAIVVLAASMGSLIGVREMMHRALNREMDQVLSEDLDEVELALAAAGEPESPILFEELDRKARSHDQLRWFVLIRDYYPLSEWVDPKDGSTPSEATDRLLASVKQSINFPPELVGILYESEAAKARLGYRFRDRVVRIEEERDLLIRVGASTKSIRRDLALIDRIIGVALAICIVAVPLGAYWLANTVTRPLAKLISTAESLEPSALSERLPIRGTGDELDQLSNAFNLLLDRVGRFLEQRRDFLANAAHELRTPLAALRSTAEVALRSKRTAQEYHELLGTIVEESGMLEVLVNQLLLLAETEADVETFMMHAEPVELASLIEASCDMFAGVADSRAIELTHHVVHQVIVRGNRHHLRQVINNLIDNAVKFTPSGGTVNVRLDIDPLQSRVHFSVQDTGIGIAEEEKPRLFDRFYRGDRSRRRDLVTRGTGLGLSICLAIVKCHGGELTVDSKPGEGSCFKVTLPIYRPELDNG